MAYKQVTVRLPEEVLNALGDDAAVERKAHEAFVLYLVQQGQISASRGAELLELSYLDMLDLMGERSVPVVNYSVEELHEEVKALQKLLG